MPVGMRPLSLTEQTVCRRGSACDNVIQGKSDEVGRHSLVDEDPPARNRVAVVSGRSIFDRSDINDKDVLDAIGAQRTDGSVVHVPTIHKHCSLVSNVMNPSVCRLAVAVI